MTSKILSILYLITLNLGSIAQNIIEIKDLKMNNTTNKYGIVDQQAPELDVLAWIDADGNDTAPITLKDFKGKFKVIYCFQSWCPGCHSHGLPSLQKMTTALKDNKSIVFMAIQTVFEGSNANTFDRIKEIQKQYDLSIPFGHDVGNSETRNISSTMYNFRTGGTPWFIFIDQNDKVIFNEYHLNTEKAIEFLQNVKIN